MIEEFDSLADLLEAAQKRNQTLTAYVEEMGCHVEAQPDGEWECEE